MAQLKEENKADSKVLASLSEEDQSQTWRTAVLLYNISLPLVMAVPILVYATDIRYDVVCILSNLSNSTITIDSCQALMFNGTLQANKQQFDSFKKQTGFRWNLF